MFSALAEERIFPVSQHRREDARRRFGSFALVALLYGLIAAAVLERRETLPPLQSVEIPVEVVVALPEAPIPPPEPKKEPTPKVPDRDEKPAYDAPRKGVAAADDGVNPTDGKQAPAPAADKAPERPAGAEGAAEAIQAPGQAEPSPPQPAVPPLPLAADGEIAPPPKSEATAPAAPAWLRAPAGHAKSTLFASIPNLEFGGAPMTAPVEDGTGPADYLNIVIGLIRRHLHKPQEPRIQGGLPYGVMVFTLDSDGRVVSSWFVQHSGSPALDRAQEDAVAAASPFPKPPFPGRAIKYHFQLD